MSSSTYSLLFGVFAGVVLASLVWWRIATDWEEDARVERGAAMYSELRQLRDEVAACRLGKR